MAKKALITNYLEIFSDEQKAVTGTTGQVRVVRYDENDNEVELKFVDTVKQAETVKAEWDKSK